MGKRLFLLIIASIIGVISNPLFLTASDSVELNELDKSGIVETVIAESEQNTEPVSTANSSATTISTPVVVVASTASYSSTSSYPANYIAISGRVLEIIDISSTAVDAGNHVNKYGSKFLYGHNSAEVFGGLSGVGVGNTFEVSYGGASAVYIVTEVGMYEKTNDTHITDVSTGTVYAMGAIARNAKGHDYAIMTCAGQSYGNGDASHRLVVYADRV